MTVITVQVNADDAHTAAQLLTERLQLMRAEADHLDRSGAGSRLLRRDISAAERVADLLLSAAREHWSR